MDCFGYLATFDVNGVVPDNTVAEAVTTMDAPPYCSSCHFNGVFRDGTAVI